jgi:hypothetical protein
MNELSIFLKLRVGARRLKLKMFIGRYCEPRKLSGLTRTPKNRIKYA